jgi:4-diphosphocytidyl-2-C-methyl-D-erythritol kinase
MTDWLLRPARPEDIDLLADIERRADERYRDFGYPSFPDDYTIPRDAAERAVASGRLVVAEDTGVVIGWLVWGRVGGELCLGQVSVLPSHGRRGVGTALLRHLIDLARARQEPSIVLNTQSDVPWGMRWYARHGFTVLPPEAWSDALRAVTREQQQAGLDWSHRVHMRWPLHPGG